MFTGLIEAVGSVRSLTNGRLTLDLPESPWPNDPLLLGESVAVNGCCLTVVATENGVEFDLSEETIRRTTFGTLSQGNLVNLERAMRLGDRLGGHIVQGHVDATGSIVSITEQPDATVIRFLLEAEHERYLIDKGSIALDGISLTVVEPKGSAFDVWVIPHTLAYTNLGQRKIGDRVNVEFDVLAKHVEKLLSREPR